MREKELRLALVCQGGVSLAIYMHGVTRELWQLLRASEARLGGRPAREDESDVVWRDLLDTIATDIDLRVICDVIAGASAGGINGVLLAHAIAGGHSLDPLRTMWLEEADVDRLLDPEARPRGRLSKFYAEPIAWAAGRQSAMLGAIEDEAVRAEVAMKLSRFVRSRWFQPPFSGEGFASTLLAALAAMEASPAGPPLLPGGLPLDLFVTATDWFGSRVRLPIHSPPEVTEIENRRLLAFRTSPPSGGGPRRLASRASLAFAARATASFPGAFPAATVAEMDRAVAATGEAWPDRDMFLASQLAGDRAPEDIALIDGSVLANAPFAPAIQAIRLRSTHREVDRRFVYIDPKPDLPRVGDLPDDRRPGFFTMILRSLADIPRSQPIRDELEAIGALGRRMERVRAILDGIAPEISEAIDKAVGGRFFLLPLDAERLARARPRVHQAAARGAGFAFGVYARLKLHHVLDGAARLLGDAAGCDPQSLRGALEAEAEARGAFAHATIAGSSAPDSPYVALLRELDSGYRIRRLRTLIRQLALAIPDLPSGPAREAGTSAKARLHATLSPFLHRRTPAGVPGGARLAGAGRRLAEGAPGAAAAAIDLAAELLDLSGLDAQADAALLDIARDQALPRPLRQALVRAWLGYPFVDIVLLPLLHGDSPDSFEELRVDRISPEDARSLRAGGTRACLQGWRLNAFGAFFSRAWRENDYLWGRLHGAERLLDILIDSSMEAGASGIDARAWKARLFAAILAAERPHLTAITPLLDELEAQAAVVGRDPSAAASSDSS
jgi:patatin-related protein